VQWFLDEALGHVGRLHEWRDSPLSFDDVAREIDAGNPICARIGWLNGSGHFVAVTGYVRAGGAIAEDLLMVRDAEFGSRPWTYREVRHSYRETGKWTDSYRTQ
jgi:hypothetical protein